MKDFKPTKYTLLCMGTGREFEDEGWVLENKQSKTPALVRAKYASQQLDPKDDSHGIYKFCDWMPLRRTLKGSAAPVTYKSEALAEELGLKNLYITFSGWFPERGARMTTCSFKETEAYSVCGRISEVPEQQNGERPQEHGNRNEQEQQSGHDGQSSKGHDGQELHDEHGSQKERQSGTQSQAHELQGKILVVASAGNTARAFAKVCSDNRIPLLLSVPEDNLAALWFEKPLNECVKLIAVRSGGDYFDAIHLSNAVLKSPRFIAEGGAKNIARRDGMATTMLSATTHIGRIPDYYFQAVGSGTGAIAAWEANLRLIDDGRWGSHKMKLMLSQNAPFVPMYDAWKADSRHILPYDDNKARRHAEIIDAKVLSNRRPPYGIVGGLYDAMKDSGGEFYAVTNTRLRKAGRLFERLEGADINPAAAVAVDSLIQAVERGDVERDAVIMLNITGGGEKLFGQGRQMWHLKPSIVFPPDAKDSDVVSAVEGLFN